MQILLKFIVIFAHPDPLTTLNRKEELGQWPRGWGGGILRNHHPIPIILAWHHPGPLIIILPGLLSLPS